ncbi:MAG: type IV pilus assembly protein PilM [Pelosinus sp.]|nr:type IV pilus assembly protein PilM [Pelosinus sp.]
MNNLLTKIDKYFHKHSDSILGIDIGTSTIKIVEVNRQKGQLFLRNAVLLDLPANILEDGYIIGITALGTLLQQTIAKNGIKAQEAVVAVSGRSIFVREVAFPTMTKDELKEAIKWDMEKYVPFAPGSYYHDFAIVGKSSEEAEMKVLLVAAPQDLVSTVVSTVRAAGLKTLAVDIESLAIYRSLSGAENAVVVDLGGQAAQVIVYQNGSPCVTRAIPINGQRFTETIMRVLELEYAEAETLKQRQRNLLKKDLEDESVLHTQLSVLVSELAKEIRRTLEYFQMQNKYAVVDKVFLTGGGAKLDNLAQQLASELDMFVAVHNPTANLSIPPAFDPAQWQEIAPQFSVAIGLALAEVTA